MESKNLNGMRYEASTSLTSVAMVLLELYYYFAEEITMVGVSRFSGGGLELKFRVYQSRYGSYSGK